MKLHILNLHLSRQGGGIFTVIKEMYQSREFLNSLYSQMYFWGYSDEYSNIDSISLPGRSLLYQIYLKTVNKIFFSKKLKLDFLQETSTNDIIHIHSLWLYLSVLASKAQKIKNARKIISVHGMLDKWALENGRMKKRLILKLFEQKNLNTANCIHALCEQEYQDIRKITSKIPIAIIPNGINLPQPQKHKTKKDTKVLLFIGRIHPKKGLENLIHAWSKVESPNWRLVITGPNENKHLEDLKILAKKLHVNTRIDFTGPKFGEDKEQLLESSDAFILPSFSEGLPMSVLEAWSYKLPILMTPECNLPDGYESNAALKIETTPESIAEGLKHLFSLSNSQLEEIGNNGFKLVKEKYTWESVARQMIQLYDWVSGKTVKPDFVRLD